MTNSGMPAGTYAEQVLPAEFIRRLGLYVANASHLEREIWCAIIHLERLDARRHSNEIVKIRKLPSKSLIKRLKSFGACFGGSVGDSIFDRSDHMLRFLDNRHMAIHGSWRREGDIFLVEYFKNFGNKDNPDWRIYNSQINLRQIDEAINDCSRLVIEIFQITRAVREANNAEIANSD